MSKTTKRSHDPRWSKVVRDLTMHPVRTGLVVLSIAVGVFAIVMVMGGRGILLESFETNFPLSAASNAVLYTSDFGDLVLDQVSRFEGVRDAEARRNVQLRYRAGDLRETADPPPGSTPAERPRTISLIAAKDWNTARLERVFPEPKVSWPPAPGEVVLEQSVKLVDDLQRGDVITVDLGDGEKRLLTVGGFAHDINAPPAMFVNRVTGYVSMDTMRKLEQPDAYSQLVITYDDRVLTRDLASGHTSDLRDKVLAPAGVKVYGSWVPDPGSHRLGDIFQAAAVLLAALGVLAALLSAFLVVNTIAAVVAQQTKQVGIMKAVGGSAFQVTRMYLLLVCAYGVLGVAIGIPLGAYAAGRFADFANGLLNFGKAPETIPAYSWMLGLAVGILLPVLAALVPVRAGARQSVAKALNSSGMGVTEFGHGFIDRVLGLVKGLPRPVALSLRNTFLRKGRLALTLTTLTLASAVVMSVISVRSSMLRTVDDMATWWLYDVEASFQQPVATDAAVREALGVPGVTAAEGWMTRGATLLRGDGSERESLHMIGLPPETEFIAAQVLDGRWLDEADEDSLVINTDLASSESLGVGDKITLKVQGEEHTWTIVGIIKGQMSGPVLFAGREALQTVVGESGASTLVVKTAGHSDAAQKQAGDRLEDRFKRVGFAVTSIETTKAMAQQISDQLGILVAFLVIMAAVLAIVGVIGLSGTMVINVLESTREIGVMRAIGASHGDIFQVFVTEGVVVGLLAWSLGALFTYPLSYALVVLLEKAIKIPLTYEFSWQGLGLWFVLVVVISAVASLLPAFRASQVSVRDAIAYE